MFCTKCGNKCDDGQRFCNNCGAPLETAPAADAPVAEVVFETHEAVTADAGALENAAENAAEEIAETVAEAPVIEVPDAAPQSEQPVLTEPAAEPLPAYQPPVYQPPQPESAPPSTFPSAPPYKKGGVGKWIGRVVLSCLPLLLTYLALLVSGIIWPGSLLPTNPNLVLSSYAPEARTIAIVILAVICASVLVQIICLAVWALRKKGDPALRDWAVAFTIAAIAVIVVAILLSLGMMLFNDRYPRLFSFLESYVSPVRYISLLFSAL